MEADTRGAADAHGRDFVIAACVIVVPTADAGGAGIGCALQAGEAVLDGGGVRRLTTSADAREGHGERFPRAAGGGAVGSLREVQPAWRLPSVRSAEPVMPATAAKLREKSYVPFSCKAAASRSSSIMMSPTAATVMVRSGSVVI